MLLSEIARLFVGLAVVIGMIASLAWLAQKAGIANNAGGIVRRKRRLAVIEALPLDGRRRLAIVKCDQKEHLIVLNPNNVTVIERGLESIPEEITGETITEDNPFASKMPGFAQLVEKLRRDDKTAA